LTPFFQFSVLYRRWQKKLDYSMRQDHRGGEKLFVDYGEGLSLIDARTSHLSLLLHFIRSER
jgi:hypothetical protein